MPLSENSFGHSEQRNGDVLKQVQKIRYFEGKTAKKDAALQGGRAASDTVILLFGFTRGRKMGVYLATTIFLAAVLLFEEKMSQYTPALSLDTSTLRFVSPAESLSASST